MPSVDHVLRVFTDPDGRFGDFLGVYLDTADWSDELCQERARDRGFSETVFIDDVATGRIRIFTPAMKGPFAGHPAVGAAWLLDALGHEVHSLTCDAGTIHVVATRQGATVLGDPAWVPGVELRQVGSPAEVDAYAPWADSHHYVWAWLDEASGVVRARAFLQAAGITEDEATGGAAMLLAAELNRPVRIHQGAGSRLAAGPTHLGKAALSGDVVMDR